MKNLLFLMMLPFMFLQSISLEKTNIITLMPINVNNNKIISRKSKYNKLFEEINLSINEKNKLIDICKKLNTNPSYLASIIWHESRFKTMAVNKSTKAIGLIQFMPSTLKGLNVSYNNMLHMNIEQQLDIVMKYLKRFKNLNSPTRLSLCIFYPYALKYTNNNNYIFGSEISIKRAHKIALCNKGFDLNKDKVITMCEYKSYINNKIF